MFASQELAVRVEPNPILAEIRRVYRANGWKLRPAFELRMLDDSYPNARPEHIAQAREVLTRLIAARLPRRRRKHRR